MTVAQKRVHGLRGLCGRGIVHPTHIYAHCEALKNNGGVDEFSKQTMGSVVVIYNSCFCNVLEVIAISIMWVYVVVSVRGHGVLDNTVVLLVES